MHKAMLPVIVKVHLSVRGCYTYYVTAANLDTLYPPVKIFRSANLHERPQYVYTSVAKEFICAHMDFWCAGDILRAP